MKIALITPTYVKDRELVDILCTQVGRYCEADVDHFVIPSQSERVIFKHLSGRHRHIIFKEELLELLVRRLPFQVKGKEIFLFDYGIPVRGWIVQQIVKFCAPDITDADIFVYLDSDVFPIRRFSAVDFTIDGKLRFLRKPGRADIEPHRKWHKSAGRMFGLAEKSYYGADYIGHFVSWRRDTCLELRKFLQEKSGTPWSRLLSRARHISEYILYGVFVDQVLGGDLPRHYATEAELCLSSWEFDTTHDLIAEIVGSLRDDHLAVNLQSNLGLPTEFYRELLTTITEWASRASF